MYNKKEYRNLQKYSLTQIHDLWYKFDKRYKKRNLILSNYIDEIVKEIKPNKSGEHIVYYTEKGKTKKYIFSKSVMGYGFHNRDVEMTREESLDLLLTDEKPFQMGKEFRRIYLMASGTIRHYLKEVFIDSLKFKLRNKINLDVWTDNQILTVKIGDKTHWVKAARVNERWIDFEYISETNQDIIELK
jgi:hypothetical protein